MMLGTARCIWQSLALRAPQDALSVGSQTHLSVWLTKLLLLPRLRVWLNAAAVGGADCPELITSLRLDLQLQLGAVDAVSS
jgi:hypothetical protein